MPRDPHEHRGLLLDACRLTLHDALAVVSERRGEHVFVETEGRSVTYAEMAEQSRRLAGGLRELGVARGSAVVLLSEDPVVAAIAWFASSRLGCPLVPLNPSLSPATLARTLRGLGPQVVVIDERLLPILREVVGLEPSVRGIVVNQPVDTPGLPEPIGALAALPLEAVLTGTPEEGDDAATPTWTDAALVLGTSGSTGPPKRSVLSHGYCLHSASEFAAARHIGPDSTLYCPLPLFHVNALTTTLLAALLVGATSAHDPKFSARTFWARTRRFGATHVSLIGSMIPRLNAEPARDADRDHPVKTILTSPARPGMTAPFMDRFGLDLVFAYGQTEATPVIGPTFAADLPAGSTGRRNPAFEIVLLDDAGNPVADGAIGQIVCRPLAEGVTFDGYVDDPVEIAARRRGDWHRTGDLARIVDGDCYVYVGRKGDMIRRAGENVSAVEVEAALLGVPGVAEVAAHGIAGPLDEEIKVWVVCSPGARVTAEAIVTAARSLPRFARPRYLEFADALPRTASDHLKRSELVDRGLTVGTVDLHQL